MTLQELEQALQNVTAVQMQSFLSRGMMLAQRDAIDSQINVLRQEQTAYNANVETQAQQLQAQRAQLQQQIDHL